MRNTSQINDAFCAILGDGVWGSHGGYLARSAAMMREWVCDSLASRDIEGKVTCWDPHVALVLTETGPKYLLKEDLGGGYTRCGYLYFFGPFADLVLALTLSPETRGHQRRVYNGLIQHFISLGCGTTVLMPRPHRNIRDIQMMIADVPTTKKILRRGMEFLTDDRDFEVLTHDGTYKVTLGIIGQPGHGIRVRTEDGPPGNTDRARRAAEAKGDQHVVQTLRTKDGCSRGVAGSFSESAELVWAFVKEPLGGNAESLSQVRLLFSDSAEKLDTARFFSLMPDLLRVAAGPLHRALEVEGFYGQAKSNLSVALRALHAKFTQTDGFQQEKKGAFFSKGLNSRVPATKYSAKECRLLEALAPADTADEIAAKLRDPTYAGTPFRSRYEYEIRLCALVVRYESEMHRKNAKGRTLLCVMRSAAAAEYLLKGMRYTCREITPGPTPLPVGTTGNEALHAELNKWFGNMNRHHADRFELALSLSLLAKMLGHVALACFPRTVQLRHGKILRRLLGKLRFSGIQPSDHASTKKRGQDVLKKKRPTTHAGQTRETAERGPKQKRRKKGETPSCPRICYQERSRQLAPKKSRIRIDEIR